jgi:ATP-dependent Clp protease adaptor protein ClpS
MSTELASKIDTTFNFKQPKKYKVVMMNDDLTPMEFVIEILIGIFYKTEAEAQQITFAIHNTGSGIAGVFNYEVAEQKVYETTNISRSAGFPLGLKVEEE